MTHCLRATCQFKRTPHISATAGKPLRDKFTLGITSSASPSKSFVCIIFRFLFFGGKNTDAPLSVLEIQLRATSRSSGDPLGFWSEETRRQARLDFESLREFRIISRFPARLCFFLSSNSIESLDCSF